MNLALNSDHKYSKSQVNGTIYITTRLHVAAAQLEELESGAGELFLTNIPKKCSVECVMQIAMELGDIYKLRFKIDFSGSCRGFAYLQYIDVQTQERALQILQLRFWLAKLKIQVRESMNRKILLLSHVNHLTPLQVYQELRKVCRYIKLCVHEYKPYKFSYMIVYRNNDEAAIAHHSLRTKIGNFGAGAFIGWLDKGEICNISIPDFKCCVKLQRTYLGVLEQQQVSAYGQSECKCFRV